MNPNSMSPEEQAILARLRSVEGHLHAIVVMFESGWSRDQVLHQLGAVQSALRAAGCALACHQAERSLEAILASPDEAERQAELNKLREIYRLMAVFSYPISSSSEEGNP